MPGLEERIERSHHVFYEFQMLAETAYRLSFRPRDFDQVTRNAYLEAFGIHLRALVDFLYSVDSGHDTDVRAKHFFSVKSRERWNPKGLVPKEKFDSDCERVNEEIAHLTTRRHIDPEDKPWRFWEIYERIRPLLEEFDQHVDPQYLDTSVWDKDRFLLSAPQGEHGNAQKPLGGVSGVVQSPSSGGSEVGPGIKPTTTTFDDFSSGGHG